MNRILISIFIILFSTLFLIAMCSSKGGDRYKDTVREDNISGLESRETNRSNSEEDLLAQPLKIKENTVLFLVLSKKEYDAADAQTKLHIEEIISEFRHYANSVAQILEDKRLCPIYTPNKNLVFVYSDGKTDQLHFDTNKGFVAIALFGKGKKPEIYYDVILSDDIINAVSKYFEISFAR